MTLEDLQTLLDFHYWARDRVLEAAGRLTPEQFTRAMGGSFQSVRDTLVHIYSADWAWDQLWHGISPAPAAMPQFEQFPDLDSIRAAWTAHESRMRAFLNSLGEGDASRLIECRTGNRPPISYSIAQMVQHVVNHGSYHRGQLATMFRQLGLEPLPGTDLITYYREQAGKAEIEGDLSRPPAARHDR